MAKKKASVKAPVKKATKKATVKKATVAPENTVSGRPAGSKNYIPENALTVRERGEFRGMFEGPVGPKWIRVYAKDQENSLLLDTLASLLESEDASLLRLLKKSAK